MIRRDDYAPCQCAEAQEHGVEVCGGCEEFRAARDQAEAETPVVPLCPTCRLWGKEACRTHQRPRGRRGCPGCGGKGFITWGRLSANGAMEAGEDVCPCTKQERE